METKEFIERSNEIHNGKYIYDKSVYTGYYDKLCIICPEHGEFWQSPKNHLRGRGCKECAKESRSEKLKTSQDEVIRKFRGIHGDKYIYDKVEFDGVDNKVRIICPEHGEFWMTPKNHMKGQGCKKCGGKLVFNNEDFVKEATKVHNGKYTYISDYIDTKTKVRILCPIHGEFEQTPNCHLAGQGCPKCGKLPSEELLKERREDFIHRAKAVHGDRYNYDEVDFINVLTDVAIICPEHGIFFQKPTVHLAGNGCSKCSGKHNYTTEEFIEKAREIHGEYYTYNKTEYNKAFDKITVTCPEHGDFEIKAYSHLQGQGCPKCRMSKMERKTMRWLEKHNIEYQYEAKYDWLIYESAMSLDFYIPEYNIAIECQGEEHFRPVSFGSKKNVDEMFRLVVDRDKTKKRLCEEHEIPLYYINYDECLEERLEEIFSELYDNRADRVEYNYDRELTMGGAGKGNMITDPTVSKFNSVEMYNPDTLYFNGEKLNLNK